MTWNAITAGRGGFILENGDEMEISSRHATGTRQVSAFELPGLRAVKRWPAFLLLATLAAGCAPTSFAPPDEFVPPDGTGDRVGLATVRVASGLARPVFAVSPSNDFDRLFILEQHSGHIKILNLTTGLINSAPFLTVTGLTRGLEEGLLGMAFAPDYDSSGRFYLNYTAGVGAFGSETRIVRGTVSVDPDV